MQNLKATAVLLDSKQDTAVARAARVSGAIKKSITSFDQACGRTAAVRELSVLIRGEGEQICELPSRGCPEYRATLTDAHSTCVKRRALEVFVRSLNERAARIASVGAALDIAGERQQFDNLWSALRDGCGCQSYSEQQRSCQTECRIKDPIGFHEKTPYFIFSHRDY